MKTPTSDPSDARQRITEWARSLGFDAISFVPARLPETASADLETFLERGYHGDMAWMAEHAARRRDPQALWDQAQTAIIVGHNYAPEYNPLDFRDKPDIGLISCYALGKDYHDIIKKKLRVLAERIADELGGQVKLFVDTAPLMEKPLAAQGKIGWQGKHTCVVSREFGSWLFLGEILTDKVLPYDEPTEDSCGKCTRCLDICPTQAFDKAHELDARKCIAYLTIEHQGHIPIEFRRSIGNRIYGCDDCLAVCPWNKFARQSSELAYHARETMPAPQLEALLQLDDSAFREKFAGSPIKRIKRDRFIRNVLIAAGNSGNQTYLPYIRHLLADTSPLVRAMAVWALLQLAEEEEITASYAHYAAHERDPSVLAEWHCS